MTRATWKPNSLLWCKIFMLDTQGRIWSRSVFMGKRVQVSRQRVQKTRPGGKYGIVVTKALNSLENLHIQCAFLNSILLLFSNYVDSTTIFSYEIQEAMSYSAVTMFLLRFLMKFPFPVWFTAMETGTIWFSCLPYF